MGLTVYVYRNGTLGDCTNRGLSSKVDQFCVVNVPGPFEPTEECPAARLVKGPYRSVRLVPEVYFDDHLNFPMFGGNYAGTSDSRFNRTVEKFIGASVDIVKIFDRVE